SERNGVQSVARGQWHTVDLIHVEIGRHRRGLRVDQIGPRQDDDRLLDSPHFEGRVHADDFGEATGPIDSSTAPTSRVAFTAAGVPGWSLTSLITRLLKPASDTVTV